MSERYVLALRTKNNNNILISIGEDMTYNVSKARNLGLKPWTFSGGLP